MKYEIQAGESFYNISVKRNISLFSILISNPDILDPLEVKIGQVINIPTVSADIVNTNSSYTYEQMVYDINNLKENYPFLKIITIGKSVLGKDIYAIILGKGQKNISFNGSHHANEWITTPVLMKYIEDYAKSVVNGVKLYGYDVTEIYQKSTISIVPMVNPDGVNLVINGLADENSAYHKELLEWNGGSTSFDDWNSNIRGVDINHNYDAGWEIYKEEIEPELGIFGPSPKRYSGPCVESEPETKALVDFTCSNDFKQVIALHSQGEIIYWDYMNKAPEQSIEIVNEYSKISGYETGGIAPGPASLGGYKDWFIEKFKRPGFTVELGVGQNPLPISDFDDIYSKSVRILLLSSLV